MSHVHAIVWLDHLQARVIGFSLDETDTVEIRSESEERQLHRKSGTRGTAGHMPDDHGFFDQIIAALTGVREIIVCGPGTAKTVFERYAKDRHAEVGQRILACETMDHPKDHELLAHARASFKRIDQLGIT